MLRSIIKAASCLLADPRKAGLSGNAKSVILPQSTALLDQPRCIGIFEDFPFAGCAQRVLLLRQMSSEDQFVKLLPQRFLAAVIEHGTESVMSEQLANVVFAATQH